MFDVDPLPQRPASGSISHHANLDSTVQSELAERTVLYDEEELDNISRDQYEQVWITMLFSLASLRRHV